MNVIMLNFAKCFSVFRDYCEQGRRSPLPRAAVSHPQSCKVRRARFRAKALDQRVRNATLKAECGMTVWGGGSEPLPPASVWWMP